MPWLPGPVGGGGVGWLAGAVSLLRPLDEHPHDLVVWLHQLLHSRWLLVSDGDVVHLGGGEGGGGRGQEL